MNIDLDNTTIDSSELCNLITLDTVVEDTVDTVVQITRRPDPDPIPVPAAPRKRGRKPSLLVAERRKLSVDTASEILIEGKGDMYTVSQLVRKCEDKGVTHTHLWTDIYHFLNSTDHNFVSSGGTGTRVKWGVTPPPVTVETILEDMGF